MAKNKTAEKTPAKVEKPKRDRRNGKVGDAKACREADRLGLCMRCGNPKEPCNVHKKIASDLEKGGKR